MRIRAHMYFFSHEHLEKNQMMKRDSMLSILADHYPDGIVVSVYQMAFDWMKIRPHPLNYFCTGAMGQASSHALGLALGTPDEKVVVLDGDGSLLMNLGSLVTVGNISPSNFIHFVGQNSMYEVNGEFPIPGADKINFEQMALAAGYRHAFTFDEEDNFKLELNSILNLTGPVFVCLHIEAGRRYERDYKVVHARESRSIFRKALQSRIGLIGGVSSDQSE